MPIIGTMEFPHESNQPGTAGGEDTPKAEPAIPGTDLNTGSGQESITPERLTRVIRRLETGFYDSPEVREQIARRVCEELDP